MPVMTEAVFVPHGTMVSMPRSRGRQLYYSLAIARVAAADAREPMDINAKSAPRMVLATPIQAINYCTANCQANCYSTTAMVNG